ncbi:MAG: YhdH/YhfP family quinone oxidoreductase [Desulfosarcina sp.]|nr:YhdH/YhfP family quinone oxidoreductase [Desulfosarcina sp.]MBC2741861.1 YhdH/YhfP family quinone oxidoreductase [Desulfosarcina sp.]MBC2764774.1 YhdH/YhfP family quinone oxidoreductase [Desulfosarcina sp.]
MTSKTFNALVVDAGEGNSYVRQIKKRTVDDLPDGDVLIRVHYSSLNYKDALSATGNKGVTRNYPHTPGIDAAGLVAESKADAFAKGDQVLVTGYDLGMNTAGGFGQYVRVPAGWVVPLPDGLSLKESMIYGTAGFTAGMSILFLTERINPEDGPVLVTGATGGVGSVSVAILAKLGYTVAAVTGKTSGEAFLKGLGAADIIGRSRAADTSGRPLLKAQWAGVVDTVGGEILTTAIKSTQPWGTVTCCGNVASPDLSLTVFPFILRGIRLIGIDSQNCPMGIRLKVWENLTGPWKIDGFKELSKEISLDGLSDNIDLILKGQQKGRVVVDLGASGG